MKWIIFLLSLPVSVYIYASILAVIDASTKVRPLVRLVTVCCLVLIAVTLTEPDFLMPMLYSLITVVAIHWVAFYAVRQWGLGMPIYRNSPPPSETEPAE